MRHSNRLIALLFGGFVIYFFSYSCQGSEFAPQAGKELKGPIFITGFDITDSSLTLVDSTTGHDASYVRVSKSQLINWVNKVPGKIEIIEIKPDPNYQPNDSSFFSPDDLPHRLGNSPRWEAKIGSPSNSGILIEKYNIKWALKSTNDTFVYDPLLQLNP
ncbi:MAG TPA: hypothetical protein VFT78_06995 [Hanamia sp.]|jgi:hypothetical protein|nr:hypothetical protein [Hanamia sp.]